MKKAFTLVELIFVIVIIGVLAAVAIPKFSNLSDNAKISAELSTASAVQSAIDAAHAEWITNRCNNWTWGPNDTGVAELNNNGYPSKLSDDTANDPLKFVIKNAQDWEFVADNDPIFTYKGPASSKVSRNIKGKPNIGDFWEYNATAGTFTLDDN